MPVMSDCGSKLLSVSNLQKFAFTLPDTNSSVKTEDGMGWKTVLFCSNGSELGFGIHNDNDGDKWVWSHANEEGYNVSIDSQGKNILTGEQKGGTSVSLKMLEVFEVECLQPAK